MFKKANEGEMTKREFLPVSFMPRHELLIGHRVASKPTHSDSAAAEAPAVAAIHKIPLGSYSSGGIHATANRHSLNMDQPGFLRLRVVLEIFPVSRASWYAGIAKGIYPQSIALGPRSVGWRTSDIKALIDNPSVVSNSATSGSVEIKSKRKGDFTT